MLWLVKSRIRHRIFEYSDSPESKCRSLVRSRGNWCLGLSCCPSHYVDESGMVCRTYYYRRGRCTDCVDLGWCNSLGLALILYAPFRYLDRKVGASVTETLAQESHNGKLSRNDAASDWECQRWLVSLSFMPVAKQYRNSVPRIRYHLLAILTCNNPYPP